MNLKRVVVTGLGALTPIGNNKNEFSEVEGWSEVGGTLRVFKKQDKMVCKTTGF